METSPVYPADRRIRVLYVAGTGRSGSTLVSNLLGSSADMVSLGELRYLWERGIGEASPCGCGMPIAECPFWRNVLKRCYPDGLPDVTAIVAADAELLRVRSVRALLDAGSAERTPAARHYLAELTAAYRAIDEETGGKIIVDSSNLPSYGYLLDQIPDIDVTVLHLVRDARAVAHSWSRVRSRADRGGGDARMGREGLVKSSVLWDLWNATTERLWSDRPDRYVRVRYEDVVADPQAALEPVMRMFAASGAEVPAVVDGMVTLSVCHTVAGNPARAASGLVPLVADEEWRTAMPAARKAAATALTVPFLRRYGYRVRSTQNAGQQAATSRVFVEDMHGLPRLAARVRRNATWIREQGLSRALEEKEISPVRNAVAAARKARYRSSGATPAGAAVPVFVVGLQRSGTNMLMRGLGAAPETEVHNESDTAAFERYKLRPLPVIEQLVAQSRHSHVLFKPLCDSHRTDAVLDELTAARRPLAVWTYRDVDGRVRSALAKFGDGNLQVLREFADGTNTARWHVQRMSPATADFVRSFDYERLSPASGAALMWFVRNQLYFDIGLDGRTDSCLVSYNAFLADPETTMQKLCAFLGFAFRPDLVRHMGERSATYREPLDIDERIRAACDALTQRLEGAAGTVGSTHRP
jgi:hypothetical protein